MKFASVLVYTRRNIQSLWGADMSSQKVDRAISLVKDLILAGEFRPGDKLPNEAGLAARLDVSRNSLREAVRAMQTMRILEARQGDGTYVSDLDPVAMLQVLSFAVDVSDARSVLWYLELRQVLELAAVQEAAARRNDADLADLREIHKCTLIEEDPQRLMALDAAFHDRIAAIGANPFHAALLRIVSAPTVRARIWRQRMEDQDYQDLRNEHGAILDAIERRAVQAAQSEMWRHLNGVVSWVRDNAEALAKPEEPK
ncbi:FadR/GntR family transcriptional regulator [Phaeobacter sp. J2-8]|uniref:FadR/GntR family transcriptional regulator n=1 Tax=Phaeobacter sp. J2-8 TaxID=2931394 RepID=UPI001FD04886|nr:FadR/GntR family transcriptional regulator [Phaeobacter sp. J2-8]MCJ7873364.1 FadR family transcriptional regulator [Phaeobacter sp. J2-8]